MGQGTSRVRQGIYVEEDGPGKMRGIMFRLRVATGGGHVLGGIEQPQPRAVQIAQQLFGGDQGRGSHRFHPLDQSGSRSSRASSTTMAAHCANTSATAAKGRITAPVSSAQTTSPGAIVTPSMVTGAWIVSVFKAQRLFTGEKPRQATGKPLSRISATSRTAPWISAPATPFRCERRLWTSPQEQTSV